ncbi:hypothetical protein GCM10010169_60480 [Micromonospora fulviviridis]|nr:hypothetical protein GCM10010169_60480 [Micromonospora fulviviridis]
MMIVGGVDGEPDVMVISILVAGGPVADAARNFDAILRAATDVFGELGAEATLEEVTCRTGARTLDHN